MHILQFDCSICKKLYGKPKQRHGLKKGAELTAHEWFAQCMGCGTFGIKIVDDEGLESYLMATYEFKCDQCGTNATINRSIDADGDVDAGNCMAM
jgi:hypothetical protein